MRLSRLAAVMFVLAGVASLSAHFACSSQSSGFGEGSDSGVPTDGTTGSKPDGRTSPDVVVSDVPTLKNNKDVKADRLVSHDGGFRDAKVKVDGTTCLADAGKAGPGPVQHTCIIYPTSGDDDNECDGHHDLPGFPANGAGGNGFDDNCNGLVDEGCTCANVGTTKTCYLVPASQTVNGVPVGWCATNSKGTVDCAQHGEGTPTWSGNCRGAQPPYAEDVCAPGDFNCDGKEENPTGESCACVTVEITCPTAALTTVPYPPPSTLPLEVNAADWFSVPSEVTNATNWSWSMTGGDCDNILPNPTFGLYPTGGRHRHPRALDDEHHARDERQGARHGRQRADGQHRHLPGLLAQWRLHPGRLLRVQGQGLLLLAADPRARAGAARRGVLEHRRRRAMMSIFTWRRSTASRSARPRTPGATSSARDSNEDCYYGNCYAVLGQPTRSTGATRRRPRRAARGGARRRRRTSAATRGSTATPTACPGSADKTETNPNAGSLFKPFCGPENINLDNPGNGDQFAVGIRFYTKNSPAADNPIVHVNLYCDGARVFAGGYDPVAGNNYPQLITAGEDGNPAPDAGEGGDMWKVALVTTTLSDAGADASGLGCQVLPTQSQVPDTTRDGPTTAYCVDNATLNGAYSQVTLTSGGGVPANANALCYH